MPEIGQTMAVYSTLAGDPEYAELVDWFVQEIPHRVQAIENAFNSQNREELRRLAHQLKGASGSYGFSVVTPLAAELEQASASDAGESTLLSAVQELMNICAQLRAGTPTNGFER